MQGGGAPATPAGTGKVLPLHLHSQPPPTAAADVDEEAEDAPGNKHSIEFDATCLVVHYRFPADR